MYASTASRELAREGMFGGEDDVGDAEHGVAPRRVHADGVAALAVEIDLAADRLPDPIALHVLRLVGPVEGVEPREELLGVLRDLEEPLR